MDASARERIRAARRAKGLSLRELGLRVKVSPSLLSQIENGHSNPSVSTLYAMVAELGISLDTILNPTESPAPSSEPGPRPAEPVSMPNGRDRSAAPVVTHPERAVLKMDSGVIWEQLTRGPSGNIEALLVTYEPGGTSSSTGMLMTHNSYEFAYLFEGELTLQLGFESHVIRTGDSLEFDASRPHLYRNNRDVPARGIWYVLDRPSVPAHDAGSDAASELSIFGSPSKNPTSAVEVLKALKRR